MHRAVEHRIECFFMFRRANDSRRIRAHQRIAVVKQLTDPLIRIFQMETRHCVQRRRDNLGIRIVEEFCDERPDSFRL